MHKLISNGTTNAGLATLAAGCRGLTSMSLSGCDNITDVGVASLAARCRGVTSMVLSSYGPQRVVARAE